MDELRVPKHSVSIEVMLEGGDKRRLVVFLADFTDRHSGAEQLSDLLEGSSPFIPARDADGAVRLLSRAAIVTASTESSAAAEAVAEGAYHHQVEVRLRGGHSLKGAMEYAMEPEHSRVLDYLAQPSAFFVLRQGKDVVFVSKQHTVDVTALDS